MRKELTLNHQGAQVTIKAPEGYVFADGPQPRLPNNTDYFIYDLIIGLSSTRFILRKLSPFVLGQVYKAELFEYYKDQIPKDAVIIYSEFNTGHNGQWESLEAAEFFPKTIYKYWTAVLPAKE